MMNGPRLFACLLALLPLGACHREREEAPTSNIGEPTEAGLDRTHKGEAAPTATFRDPDGEETSLADFKGSPVLLNLWATWCAPCVKELPTLDALAGTLPGQLKLVTLSQDMGEQAAVGEFLAKLGTTRLEAWQDADMAISSEVGANIMPTTILYDADGNEVWRFVGDMDWTSEQAKTLLAEVG